ncbi:hypothetical protein JAAARDRAFT_39526 [Jaapia argillacea MUCL 33604]|uniref:Uncharacterized protein n=1 Tax=Jaapia argillacea MUCL 33604 TaxID=933084 RepID=A0A067PE17_9AGAM|nr:hypothetical protein JAAARDRAFT_39526 [Jaapia argillacea MUCL 33604]
MSISIPPVLPLRPIWTDRDVRWGGWISSAGKRFEQLVKGRVADPSHIEQNDDIHHTAAPSADVGPSLGRSFTVPANEILDAVEHAGDLGLDLEVGSASETTASDLPGAGRTVGGWISKAGTKVESAVTNVAERFGSGPNAIMDRILTRAQKLEKRYRLQQGGQISPSAVVPSSSFLKSPRSFLSLVQDPSVCQRFECEHIISDARIQADFRRLVTFLKDNNNQSQFLATYYIMTIVCAFPQSQYIFQRDGALSLVRKKSLYLASLPRHHRDRDLLLHPSRKALVLLSETQALTIIKECAADPPDPAPRSHHVKLLQYSMSSKDNVLAARYIADNLSGSRMLILKCLMTPDVVQSWARNAQCADPLIGNIFSTLLLRMIELHRKLLLLRSSGPSDWELWVLPLCRSLIHGPGHTHRVVWTAGLREVFNLSRLALQGTDTLAFTFTKDIQSHLFQLFVGIHIAGSAPKDLDLHQSVRVFLQPFFLLYSEFLRGWSFPGRRHDRNFDIVRSIPPRRRRHLCRQLVDLALTSRCLFDDVVKVVERDVACYDEIIGILGSNRDNSTLQQSNRLLQHLRTWRAQFPRERYQLPIGIMKGVCADDGLYSDFQGQVKVFTRSIHNRRYIAPPTMLWIDLYHCFWVGAGHLPSLSGPYKPFPLQGDGQQGKQYICCMQDKDDMRELNVFSAGANLFVPESVKSLSGGLLYVLATRDREDGSRLFYWK